jgi:hypothetical protein
MLVLLRITGYQPVGDVIITLIQNNRVSDTSLQEDFADAIADTGW